MDLSLLKKIKKHNTSLSFSFYTPCQDDEYELQTKSNQDEKWSKIPIFPMINCVCPRKRKKKQDLQQYNDFILCDAYLKIDYPKDIDVLH